MLQQIDNEALALANSYIDDVTKAIHPVTEIDSIKAHHILESLRLANRQLDKVEKEDPGATLTVTTEKGDTKDLSIPVLRATTRLYEGLARYFGLGEQSTAAKLVEQSIRLVDSFPEAHFALGAIYEDLGNKAKAQAAYKRAAELDPSDMDYRKALDRLEDVSPLGLKAEARASNFRGSWKVMGVLFLLAVLSLVSALSQGDVGSAIGLFLFWGAIAAVYFWWKSRS